MTTPDGIFVARISDGGTELLTSYEPGKGEPWPFYQRFGFREVARETRGFELVGEHEFIQMERAA